MLTIKLMLLFTLNSILRPKKGVSLIELLLTIVLAAVLATTFMVLLIGHLESTRDKIRKTDLANIGLALTQYYYDNSPGVYPTTDQFTDFLVPSYLKTMPVDPQLGSGSLDYTYIFTNDTATIFAKLERSNDKDIINMPDAKCNVTPIAPIDPEYNYCKTSSNNFQ